MKLVRYIAQWSWSSVFVLTWIVILGWWAGPPMLLIAAYASFGGLALLFSGLYAHLYHKQWWLTGGLET